MKYKANPVIVDAFKIISVQVVPDADPPLPRRVATDDGENRIATPEMQSRYIPVKGDYWVVQEDGYEYLNPKAVFERKYSAATEKELEVKDALYVCEQAFCEIEHSRQDPNWFTHGESAAWQHAGVWIRKGIDAIKKVT